jgi:hypothetical protein
MQLGWERGDGTYNGTYGGKEQAVPSDWINPAVYANSPRDRHARAAFHSDAVEVTHWKLAASVGTNGAESVKSDLLRNSLIFMLVARYRIYTARMHKKGTENTSSLKE